MSGSNDRPQVTSQRRSWPRFFPFPVSRARDHATWGKAKVAGGALQHSWPKSTRDSSLGAASGSLLNPAGCSFQGWAPRNPGRVKLRQQNGAWRHSSMTRFVPLKSYHTLAVLYWAKRAVAPKSGLVLWIGQVWTPTRVQRPLPGRGQHCSLCCCLENKKVQALQGALPWPGGGSSRVLGDDVRYAEPPTIASETVSILASTRGESCDLSCDSANPPLPSCLAGSRHKLRVCIDGQ